MITWRVDLNSKSLRLVGDGGEKWFHLSVYYFNRSGYVKVQLISLLLQ